MALKKVKQESLLDDNKDKIIKNLNPKQIEATEAINGPMLVVAGAGSGKTRVLTHKIAYMLESGISPHNILALTFTNKAANEMKSRIINLVGNSSGYEVWAGTFHSIFARLLRMNADKLGFTSNFTIYDADDSLRVIKRLMNKEGISHKDFPAQQIRAKISNAKNSMISPDDFEDIADNTNDQQASLIYQAYETELKNSNAMDFDDLLANMIRLLETSRETLDKLQNRFRYILVDEYQDTNRAQYIAIKLLAKARSNICVVGDDAQSIYRWRGADIRNILDFQKDYPYAKVVRLEQNYRSTKNILGAADSVIRNNQNQIPKTLWTENPEGDIINIHECDSDREEAEKILKIVKEAMRCDYDIGDIAVLYRTNAQSLAIENAFRREKLPYIIVGGVSFYKRKEIKDAMAYLRLLLNPSDNESLLRIINEPPRGFGQTSLKHLLSFADTRGISLFDACNVANEIQNLKPKAIKAARGFAEMMNTHKNKLNSEKPSVVAIEMIEASGILDMYKEIGTDDALDRWNNIQQLLTDISEYFRNNPEGSLDDYLEQLSLVADIDEKDMSGKTATLMTLHSAKGLEYPVVIIAGLEQGLFPLSRAELHPEEEEEERRLFYVGITRAEEILHLTYCRNRMRFGEINYQMPSSFLDEIDDKYIKWNKNGLAQKQQNTYSSSNYKKNSTGKFRNNNSNRNTGINKTAFFNDMPENESYSQIPEEEIDFKIGDRVNHAKFGDGKVVGLAGSGTFRKVVVFFESSGKKNLMLKYAKLKKL